MTVERAEDSASCTTRNTICDRCWMRIAQRYQIGVGPLGVRREARGRIAAQYAALDGGDAGIRERFLELGEPPRPSHSVLCVCRSVRGGRVRTVDVHQVYGCALGEDSDRGRRNRGVGVCAVYANDGSRRQRGSRLRYSKHGNATALSHCECRWTAEPTGDPAAPIAHNDQIVALGSRCFSDAVDNAAAVDESDGPGWRATPERSLALRDDRRETFFQ